MPISKSASRSSGRSRSLDVAARSATSGVQVSTMEAAVLRALAMTGAAPEKTANIKSASTKAAPRRVSEHVALRVGTPMTAEQRAQTVRNVKNAIERHGLTASDLFDVVRFRAKGTVDRRIKVEYFPDAFNDGSVLMRLTPATAADLPASTMHEELMLTQEAADLLNVSRPYVTKLADAGAFKGVVRTAAGHRRIPRAEVERVNAEMRLSRRQALNSIEEATDDLRRKELEAARSKSKRRWVSKSSG